MDWEGWISVAVTSLTDHILTVTLRWLFQKHVLSAAIRAYLKKWENVRESTESTTVNISCTIKGDVDLATWALERDDTELKIPYMNMAKEVKWKWSVYMKEVSVTFSLQAHLFFSPPYKDFINNIDVVILIATRLHQRSWRCTEVPGRLQRGWRATTPSMDK